MATVFECPYWKWQGKLVQHCENCKITFPDKQARDEMQNQFCGSMDGWKDCPIAQIITHYYERLDSRGAGFPSPFR